jgi:hypothetical protein
MTAATIVVNNQLSVQILKVEHGIEDIVVFRWQTANENGRVSRSKIRYDEAGMPYFVSFQNKLYLSEAIRNNL